MKTCVICGEEAHFNWEKKPICNFCWDTVPTKEMREITKERKLYKYVDVDPNGIGELSQLTDKGWVFVAGDKEARTLIDNGLVQVDGVVYCDHEHKGDQRETIKYFVNLR